MQAKLELMLHVPQPGLYAVVLEYTSEVDTVQNVNLHIRGHSPEEVHARANIYSCPYRCDDVSMCVCVSHCVCVPLCVCPCLSPFLAVFSSFSVLFCWAFVKQIEFT